MITILFSGIKMFILSWMITRFQPLQIILEMLPNKLIYNFTKLLFSCLMCVSFWSTLIWTGDIFIASGVAFVGFWYDKIIGFYENRVRLR